MTTYELKNILIHKIAAINDASFLNAIKTMVDLKSETEILQTTPEQKAKIQEGLKDLENGDFYLDHQVESEISKWLKEK